MDPIDHSDHEHRIVQVVISGEFLRGPLDGAGFVLQLPPDHDLTDLRLSLPRQDGARDLYYYDPQPDPNSLEAALRYIGVVAH